jgi:DNA-binding transcriptional regulator YiaG
MSLDLKMSREAHLRFCDLCDAAQIKSKAAGRALKRIRLNANLSRTELAALLMERGRQDVTATTVESWENGAVTIDRGWTMIISEVIGVVFP